MLNYLPAYLYDWPNPQTPTVSDGLSDNDIRTAQTFGQTPATGIFITLEMIINCGPIAAAERILDINILASHRISFFIKAEEY